MISVDGLAVELVEYVMNIGTLGNMNRRLF